MADPKPDWVALRRVFSAPADAAPEAAAPSASGDATHGAAELAQDVAEERAAIMEFDGGLSRAEAEAFAFRHLRRAGLRP